jgi:hypothetical protein
MPFEIPFTYRPRKPEPEHRRTRQRLHRNSLIAGGDWEQPWRNTQSDDELRRIKWAARLQDERGRKAKAPHRRNGPLGHIARELLELLCNLARRGKGWLYMSIEGLAQKLGYSQSAVHAAKDALKRHGFLDWARRYVEVEGEGHARGPQVEQTSNIYRLALPRAAEELLAIFQRPAPPPVDEEARKAAMLAEMAARMRADTAVAHVLDRWALAISAREDGT